jgi:hypothetical protein
MKQIEIKVKGSEEDMRFVIAVLDGISEEHQLCLFSELCDAVNPYGVCVHCGQMVKDPGHGGDPAPHKMDCETRRWSL